MTLLSMVYLVSLDQWLSTCHAQASLDTVALATAAGRRVGCWSGLACHRGSAAGSRGSGHSGLDGWMVGWEVV